MRVGVLCRCNSELVVNVRSAMSLSLKNRRQQGMEMRRMIRILRCRRSTSSSNSATPASSSSSSRNCRRPRSGRRRAIVLALGRTALQFRRAAGLCAAVTCMPSRVGVG